jgi:hypothetical protein
MPLFDIVVDTNVLMHADNANVAEQQQSAIDLLDNILKSTVLLAIDEGFIWDDTNRSLIGGEYREHISAGTAGYYFLSKIFSSSQFVEYSRSTPAHISKKINQCISHTKPRDKTFLKVSINSSSKVFITHDQEDFHYDKRKYILDTFDVTILDAEELAL